MSELKIKDGFSGELQINIPREVMVKQLRQQEFLNSLFITQIGYFPRARFHYRERLAGGVDNILIYCIEGKGHYQTKEGSFTLHANQFMLLQRGQYHVYQADVRDPWSIYWVHFSGEKLKEFNRWLQTDEFVRPTNVLYDRAIVDQWYDMYYSLDAGFNEQNIAYANLCLYRFLAFFFCPRSMAPHVQKENPIGESIAYMKSNIERILTVNELAGHLNYSASHYTAMFKFSVGTPPIDYFIKLKIHYACQLLSQTEMRINEIANKLGYDDSFYFSRLFKKVEGKSPKEYRAAINKRVKSESKS